MLDQMRQEGALKGNPPNHGAPISRRDAKRAECELSILAAARQLISEEGYEEMTMDGLAAAAGVSKPTLYHRFPNKEAIFINVIIDLLRSLDIYFSQIPQEKPPLAKLEQGLSYVFVEKFHVRKCVVGVAAKAEVTANLRSHPDYIVAFGRVKDWFIQTVEEAKAEGTVDPNFQSGLFAHVVFSVLRDDVDSLFDSCPGNDPTAVLDNLTQMFINSLKCPLPTTGKAGEAVAVS